MNFQIVASFPLNTRDKALQCCGLIRIIGTKVLRLVQHMVKKRYPLALPKLIQTTNMREKVQKHLRRTEGSMVRHLEIGRE